MILDFIKFLPVFMGDEVQYYYRRGNLLFFRKPDKSKTIKILVSSTILEETKKTLTFNNIYSTNNKVI
jgi:phage protein D